MKCRILHLEDDPLDAELILRRLEADGLDCQIDRVDTEAAFLQALERGGVDLVLADFSLPGADGMEALRLARQVKADLPFLIVSGVIGEEAAVDSLQNGATDYILKDRLSRLTPAVRRALDEAALRRDRESLGDQLTRAQKLEIFGELAGGVAHDYNNILTIIMANSGLLMAGLAEGTRLHKHASQIEYACGQAASLTRQLLVFSRDRGRDAAVLDLNGIVQNAESMLARLLPENVELAVYPANSPLHITADRGDLEQVLINLVLNARDAIRSHGTIRIETGRIQKDRQELVFLKVRDNGAGMTSEVKARVFEPFFTTKPEGSGTGLGLATCRRLIQSMDGQITVTSHPGRGTEFRILWPAAEGGGGAPNQIPVRAEMPRGCEKILLAEDNHMLRDMIAGQLEELGYEVLQASNGIEGLDVFAQSKDNPPVLVIADVALPLLSGREMVRLLQRSSPGLRVLHTSGHSDHTIAALGFQLPAGDVLRKPFTLAELTLRIREILSATKQVVSVAQALLTAPAVLPIFRARSQPSGLLFMENIRNIAIIAHVDHGKTTLVDQLLKQAGTFRANQKTDERMMDSMDLEREKGITIRAKNAAFRWKDYHVNIVDTPGHADFGGEVERIMKMVDGVLLVVDSHDGPQAQTKFVLRKAMENGLKPIVVINKIDRENARPHKVLDMVFELFMELGASDEQLDFPHIYASAKQGFAKNEVADSSDNMEPLYEAIVKHIPPPPKPDVDFFRMLVSNLDYSDYLGRIAYGRIISGKVALGQQIVCIHKDNRKEKAKVTAIFSHEGLEKVQIQEASAGDIVGISGFEEIFIGETLVDTEDREALPFVEIDPPTISMKICVNDSPLAGREGKLLTARQIRDRLIRETRGNVSISVADTDVAGHFDVKARGEMQIAVLVEQMRREGFELLVSRPEVIFKRAEDGTVLEPMETLYVDVPPENLGDILQNLAGRKTEILNMEHNPHSVLVQATIPTRGIIGFETDLVNLTKGHGICSHLFKEYGPHKGEIPSRNNGVLVSMEGGTSMAYALDSIQERGRLFIGPQEEIYEGMIIGENARPDDMPVNPCKAKKLTNMRSQGDGKGISLAPPIVMSLERSLEYIAPDEYVEVTPKSLRLRKKILDANARKRAEKSAGVFA